MTSKPYSRMYTLLLCPLFLLSLSGTKADAQQGKPVEGKTGMVVSAHPLSSKIGVEILRKGGNAVDAAVATAFGLGVAEPNASGLGGGGFILIYMARSKEVTTLDYREKAPLKATADMYRLTPEGKVVDDEITVGHKAVAVPGTLAGLTLALKKYGTMSLKEVMAPAITLAEEGYEVSKTFNGMMKDNFDKLSKFPPAAQVYLKDGLPYEPGDRIVLRIWQRPTASSPKRDLMSFTEAKLQRPLKWK